MNYRLIIPKGKYYLIDAINDKGQKIFHDGDGLPNGIINKKYTGIGATTLEFKSKRSSILVFPYISIAWEKYEMYKDIALYIGSKPKGNGLPTSDSEIIKFHNNPEQKDKKFIVVADSIFKLGNIIGKDVYSKYSLILDEVDILQMESGFRPVLVKCFLEFEKFESKTLVTATQLKFHHESLSNLKYYEVEAFFPKTKLEFIKVNSPLDELYLRVKNYYENKDPFKLLIALNHKVSINLCISKIKSKFPKANIKALVSDSSKDDFSIDHFDVIKEGKLPGDINFVSSAYFSSVDIHDEHEAIVISLDGREHQSLSFENSIQFFGRGRIVNGISTVLSKKIFIQFPYNIRRLEVNDKYENINLRVTDFEKLFQFIDNNIAHNDDKASIQNALAGIITKNPVGLVFVDDEEKLRINKLAQDLHHYNKTKYEDYKDGFKGLLSRLNERYNVIVDARIIETDIPDLPINANIDIFLEWVEFYYFSDMYFYLLLTKKEFTDFKKPIALYIFFLKSIVSNKKQALSLLRVFVDKNKSSLHKKVKNLSISLAWYKDKKLEKIYQSLNKLESPEKYLYVEQIKIVYANHNINEADVINLFTENFVVIKKPAGREDSKIRYRISKPQPPILDDYDSLPSYFLEENIFSTKGIMELPIKDYYRYIDLFMDYNLLYNSK